MARAARRTVRRVLTSVCPVSLDVLQALDDLLGRFHGAERPQFLLLTTSPEFDTPVGIGIGIGAGVSVGAMSLEKVGSIDGLLPCKGP